MAKAKERPARSHPDQQHIEGLEPERNKRVHDAARAYRKVRDARMAATKSEVAGKDKLIEVMKEEGCEVYNDPSGYAVILNGTLNVKLVDGERGGKAEDDGEAGEE